jgi:hypothetical protein
MTVRDGPESAALAEGQFDVLHISCHAESAHQSIEDGSLIIGDGTAPGVTNPHLIQYRDG